MSNISIQCYDGETRARIYTIAYFTGLRRKELGSLSPRSFDLDALPPTVTVIARKSKHRKKDVKPLHPDLVTMLRKWLFGLDPHEPLFPKLAKRRTWLMAQKDLERIGIPYKTPEGYADFHAAGRHTHITELLRTGASLPVAMQLARHADIQTTMKYTHMGMDDEAKAIANLRWEHNGSTGERRACQNMAADGSEDSMSLNEETPVSDRGCLRVSPDVIGWQKVEAAGIEYVSPMS